MDSSQRDVASPRRKSVTIGTLHTLQALYTRASQSQDRPPQTQEDDESAEATFHHLEDAFNAPFEEEMVPIVLPVQPAAGASSTSSLFARADDLVAQTDQLRTERQADRLQAAIDGLHEAVLDMSSAGSKASPVASVSRFQWNPDGQHSRVGTALQVASERLKEASCANKSSTSATLLESTPSAIDEAMRREGPLDGASERLKTAVLGGAQVRREGREALLADKTTPIGSLLQRKNLLQVAADELREARARNEEALRSCRSTAAWSGGPFRPTVLR